MSDALDDIIGQGLVLRLISEEVIAACMVCDLDTAGQKLGAAIPEELLEQLSAFKYGKMQQMHDPLYAAWSARAILLPETAEMVGLIRFHARPDPDYIYEYGRNAAEFGYRIFRNYRRKGYATAAVIAMMEWAQAQFGVHRFLASVSPDNIPSMRLISRLGFVKVDQLMDDIDGLEEVFLLIRANP